MATGSVQQVMPSGVRSSAFRRLGTVLRERAWLIFLCALAGGAAGSVYVWRAPRAFSSTAEVRYDAESLRLLTIGDPGMADSGDRREQVLLDLKRTATSSELLRRVADGQSLTTYPRYGSTAEQAVQVLRGRVRVEVPDGGAVLSVTAQESDPKFSAALANAIANELVSFKARSRVAMLQEVTGRLEEVLGKVRDELQAAGTNVAEAPVTAATAKQTELANRLQKAGEELAAAEVRWLQLDAEHSGVQRASGQLPQLLQVQAVANFANVPAQRAEWTRLSNVFESVKTRYLAKHTNYVMAASALAEQEKALSNSVQAAVAQLEAAWGAARTRRGELQAEYDGLFAEARRLLESSASAPTNRSFNRQVQIMQEFQESVLKRLKGLNLEAGFELNPLKVTTVASEKDALSLSPDPFHFVGYGLVAGFGLGLLLCLVFGLGDTSLRTVDDAEQSLGLPVLGVVPRLKDSDTELAAAEGFRTLRTSIAVSSKGREPRTLMFTSTSPDEGKTFCALNFAVGLAQQGHKTVLIECDLRRPMAAPSLSLVKVDGLGVSDYLKAGSPTPALPGPSAGRREEGLSFAEIRRKKTGESEEAKPVLPEGATEGTVSVEEVVQRTEIANLFFVAAGRPVLNPTELLARPRLEQLLNELLQRYDRVVIDSAPVLGVSETLLLASRVQGLCFVVRGDHTPRRAVARAVEILRRADAPILGAVLNGVTPKRSDPYGQDYYYHRSASSEGRAG